jgi:hypothetical protein
VCSSDHNKSVLLKESYEKIIEKNIIAKEKLERQNLLLDNYEIENKSLIHDYSDIDSLFNMGKIQNEKLLFEIKKYKKIYDNLLKDNNILSQKIEEYKNKNSLLNNELQLAKANINNSNKFADSLKFIVNNINNENKINLDFLSKNKLIFSSATGSKYSKKGKEFTKKIKDINYINIGINTIKGLNFDLGYKELYIRIADPNGKILPFKENETFNYNNEEILFSDKQIINFNNNTFPLEIRYNPSNILSEGVYWVYIFVDGYKISETSFDLL